MLCYLPRPWRVWPGCPRVAPCSSWFPRRSYCFQHFETPGASVSFSFVQPKRVATSCQVDPGGSVEKVSWNRTKWMLNLGLIVSSPKHNSLLRWWWMSTPKGKWSFQWNKHCSIPKRSILSGPTKRISMSGNLLQKLFFLDHLSVHPECLLTQTPAIEPRSFRSGGPPPWEWYTMTYHDMIAFLKILIIHTHVSLVWQETCSTAWLIDSVSVFRELSI